MKLDKRLSACAELVDEGSVVVDVGTDHAYLPVFLVKNGISSRAIASDIGKGPLEAARKNIEKYLLSDKIKTCLSDGLKEVSPEGVTHVVVAGMGGETICTILKECDWISRCQLVLQPMSKSSELRAWLVENGFEITTEKAIVDGKFIYTVMKCSFNGEKRLPTEVERVVGGLDLTEENAVAYVKRKISQLKKSAEGKLRSESVAFQGDSDLKLAKKLEELLDVKKGD